MSVVSVSPQQIQELREAFLRDFQAKNDESVVHPTDLNRVKTDDQWLTRFLMHHDNDQKLALEMMWEVTDWRKSFKTNEINESNIRMDYMVEGGFFSRGRDKDGAALFIFKCKKHTKGSKDAEELKRCVVYMLERMERQEKGKPITIFFDMEGCGLSNMDMDFTKYLIGMFKTYYPYFLNYIIIYEMAWILNAAFKVIKSWLPEKAVQKIKMIKKAELSQWVPLDQALKCWGGEDDYVFSFVPEVIGTNDSNSTTATSKKVHFADGSPMSEAAGAVDRDTDGGKLTITPSSVITFHKDGDEYVSTLDLQNNDSSLNISYKMKTTAPEKYRVRPSAGVLAPGDRATIMVTVLKEYQVGGFNKDKFLLMSLPVETAQMSSDSLSELWKNTSGRSVTQHRLSCMQAGGEPARNGSAILVGSSSDPNAAKVSANIAQLQSCQKSLHEAVKMTQVLQLVTMLMIIVLGVVLFFMNHAFSNERIPVKACIRESEL